MHREDVERMSIATLAAALLGADYTPDAALREASRVWSSIASASAYGSAAEGDGRADYVRLLSNHYAIGLSRGMSPDAAIEFAKSATAVLLKEIDPDSAE